MACMAKIEILNVSCLLDCYHVRSLIILSLIRCGTNNKVLLPVESFCVFGGKGISQSGFSAF